MDTFRLHGNMLLGTEAAPGTEGAALRLETARLRALGAGACLVQARWDLVEPECGRYDEAALEALRERLLRLRSQDIRPVLSLHRDGEPGWFLQRGGWEREDNLRCYLRYVGKILRSLGHLAEEYITFCNPNVAVWREEGGEDRRGFLRRAIMLSHMACTHVRAYRLIHDFRARRGWQDTAVGFCLGMYPLPWEKGIFSWVFSPEALHRSLPLRAMARGDFAPPLRNVLRVRPGKWCDFAGLGWRAEAPGGRALALCCMKAARAAGVPLYVLDEGAPGDDQERTQYIYETLRALHYSHQPVLRYFYLPLADGGEPQGRGLAGPETLLRPSGRFLAEAARGGDVTEALERAREEAGPGPEPPAGARVPAAAGAPAGGTGQDAGAGA